MGGGGEREAGSPPGDDMGVGGYIDGSIPRVQGGGKINPGWIIFFVDNPISVKVQWEKDDARCRALTASLADVHF